ncbi:hypothetical protein MRB53_039300 [Persea americana]|nr:hypothetical protein MRB53_039300 [Persea americana]
MLASPSAATTLSRTTTAPRHLDPPKWVTSCQFPEKWGFRAYILPLSLAHNKRRQSQSQSQAHDRAPRPIPAEQRRERGPRTYAMYSAARLWSGPLYPPRPAKAPCPDALSLFRNDVAALAHTIEWAGLATSACVVLDEAAAVSFGDAAGPLHGDGGERFCQGGRRLGGEPFVWLVSAQEGGDGEASVRREKVNVRELLSETYAAVFADENAAWRKRWFSCPGMF